MIRVFLSLIALTALFHEIRGQAVSQEKPTGAIKRDPAKVRRLIEQLKSKDFKTRERATRELSALDEAPDALRAAATSDDPEVRRRALNALSQVTQRVEERAFKVLVANLHKIELDRLVRLMVSDKRFADDKQWELIQAITRAVTKKANELGGQRFPVPKLDMKAIPFADPARDRNVIGNRRLLLSRSKPYITLVQNSVVLCTGPTPGFNSLSNAILIVDGDFSGATVVENSLLIVRGNVGRVTSVEKSIILATGNFEGATGCDHSGT